MADLDGFYSCKRLALLGVSRKKASFSRALFKELHRAGFEVLPVNPHQTQVDGQPCHASIRDIAPGVDRAIVLLPADQLEMAVRECVDAGIKQVWVHNTTFKEAQLRGLRAFCDASAVKLIFGYCPFMFIPGVGFPHRLHKTLLSWFGRLDNR